MTGHQDWINDGGSFLAVILIHPRRRASGTLRAPPPSVQRPFIVNNSGDTSNYNVGNVILAVLRVDDIAGALSAPKYPKRLG